MTRPPATDRFVYDRYEFDPDRGRLRCHYVLGERRFCEEVTFGSAPNWGSPATAAAARLVFLLAGVSYFKTAAPLVVDLGATGTTALERGFLRRFYTEGLAEFAYRNGLDLGRLDVSGPDADPPDHDPAASAPSLGQGRPLVPFGGGIDSIVSVESVRHRFDDVSLFVTSRAGDRFAAIEAAAEVTGLPVVRAERRIDPQVLASAELGFLNGHVPVTGILSAIAVLAAVLFGHDAVVMSNEWSASFGTVTPDGRAVNHQYSKSDAFEEDFARVLAQHFGTGLSYFSLLRPYSELWVAERFALLERYHPVFHSCNRAFPIDPAARLDHWCGRCDKCCFIDLILAPFLAPAELEAIFGGREPLADLGLLERFEALVGTSPDPKPFECVGEVEECRVAAHLAARRPDRAGSPVLARLVRTAPEPGGGPLVAAVERLLSPMGPDRIPPGYRPDERPAAVGGA